MRTITKEVYTFEELLPEVQQKVIDNNRNWNVDYNWWEFTYDEIAEMWKKNGIGTDGHKKGESPFYFDLDRGWNFYAVGAYVDSYINLFHTLTLDPLSKRADNILNNVGFDIQHFGGNSAKTIVDSDYLDDEDTKLIQELIDKLCQDSLELLQHEYDW